MIEQKYNVQRKKIESLIENYIEIKTDMATYQTAVTSKWPPTGRITCAIM